MAFTKDIVTIADGVYDALWSAYHLEILNSDKKVIATVKTEMGVKGINCPTTVKVEDGKVSLVR